MKLENQTRVCKSLYCEKDSIPLFMLIFLGSLGFLLAFIWDYILLIYYNLNGFFPEICLGGIHIHHLYIGLIILLISGILYLIIKNKSRMWIMFFIGLGAGLALSDLVSHLTVDPFQFYC